MSSLAQGSLAQVEAAYSRPDIYLGSGEDESPWIPLADSSATENGAFLRMLVLRRPDEPFAVVLWVKGGAIGRHRHRGTVDGYVLEGSWRYLGALGCAPATSSTRVRACTRRTTG